MKHNNRSVRHDAIARHDKVGKAIAAEFLRQVYGAQSINDNDERFGPPIEGYFDNEVYIPKIGQSIKVEVEHGVRRFAFLDRPTCHVPERKFKNKANLFLAVSKSFVFAMPCKAVHGAPIVTYRIDGVWEDFYDVPWTAGRIYMRLGDKGRWEPYNEVKRSAWERSA